MSKRLNEEQEKFTELYRDLQDISKMKQDKDVGTGMLDSSKILKEYKQELSLSGVKSFFSEWEADTPEEIEVLQICKVVIHIQNTLYNIKLCGGLGYLASVGFTGIINIVLYAEYLPIRPRIVSQFMGLFLGGMYGLIISNKPNLVRFDSLGTDYLLGRIANDEIMQWGSESTILESKLPKE